MKIPNPTVWLVEAIYFIFRVGAIIPEWVYKLFALVLVGLGLFGSLM